VAQVHKSADERRRDFIDAAVAVMRRKGMGQTTSRDVAREAGVSTGLLHHYFDSHDQLLATAFEEVVLAGLHRMRDALAEIPDPAARLDLLIELFAPEGDDWQYQVWLDVWSAAARHPLLQQVSERINAQWQALMGDVFREGEATGAFTCPDPDAAAWRVLALLDAMALQTVAHQSDIPRATMHGWVRRAARAEAGLPPIVTDTPAD
jgi:AcrR family transcriptional regulator